MNRLVIPTLLLAAVACGGNSATPVDTVPAPAGSNNRVAADLITEAEIAKTAHSNALEVVQSLRPSMLRARPTTMSPSNDSFGFPDGAAAGGGIVVYFDEVRLGPLSHLSTIPALRIQEIRYINSRDATTRWGTGHGSGVIQVISKKQ